jgi:hypothetical protein
VCGQTRIENGEIISFDAMDHKKQSKIIANGVEIIINETAFCMLQYIF